MLVRHGRLAGTARVDRGTDPRPALDALRLSAERVEAPVPPAGAAHPEETDLLLGWLERPGVRVVDVDGEWSCPVRSAQRVDPVAAVGLELVVPRVADDDAALRTPAHVPAARTA